MKGKMGPRFLVTADLAVARVVGVLQQQASLSRLLIASNLAQELAGLAAEHAAGHLHSATAAHGPEVDSGDALHDIVRIRPHKSRKWWRGQARGLYQRDLAP